MSPTRVRSGRRVDRRDAGRPARMERRAVEDEEFDHRAPGIPGVDAVVREHVRDVRPRHAASARNPGRCAVTRRCDAHEAPDRPEEGAGIGPPQPVRTGDLRSAIARTRVRPAPGAGSPLTFAE